MSFQLSPALLMAIFGFVLAAVIEFVPSVGPWFQALQPKQKQLFMLVAMAVIALAVYGVGCYTTLVVIGGLVCTSAGLSALLSMAFLTAFGFGVNQVSNLGIKALLS